MDTLESVKSLLDPITREKGCFVLDVEFKREGPERVLRITLDKPGGITMEECAQVNTKLGEILEQSNAINEHYVLEVTSPGLDRTLKKDSDFEWALGKNIKVSTYGPLDGKNVFKGKLFGLGDNAIVIEENGVSTEIPRDMIAKAKLDPEIDWNKGK